MERFKKIQISKNIHSHMIFNLKVVSILILLVLSRLAVFAQGGIQFEEYRIPFRSVDVSEKVCCNGKQLERSTVQVIYKAVLERCLSQIQSPEIIKELNDIPYQTTVLNYKGVQYTYPLLVSYVQTFYDECDKACAILCEKSVENKTSEQQDNSAQQDVDRKQQSDDDYQRHLERIDQQARQDIYPIVSAAKSVADYYAGQGTEKLENNGTSVDKQKAQRGLGGQVNKSDQGNTVQVPPREAPTIPEQQNVNMGTDTPLE